jgi:hypothetical protein
MASSSPSLEVAMAMDALSELPLLQQVADVNGARLPQHPFEADRPVVLLPCLSVISQVLAFAVFVAVIVGHRVFLRRDVRPEA